MFYSIVVDISKTQWMVLNKITIHIVLQVILNIYSKCFLAHRIAFVTSVFWMALQLELLFYIHKMKQKLVRLHISYNTSFRENQLNRNGVISHLLHVGWWQCFCYMRWASSSALFHREESNLHWTSLCIRQSQAKRLFCYFT